ncbi:MAG TPA: ABC transporter ATP-binding protein [Acidimicrobiia bacterium]|nr:ABC transporter ATP-binding protein [Acidimicrobiia bacterium]
MIPAVELVGVKKSYGDVVALADVSLQFPAGQLTGFLGPNGAGKTTTFRAILGLTRPQEGRIEVLGTPIASDLSRLVKRIGAVVEEPGLHRTLDAVDNMRVAALTLGFGAEHIDELLDFVGLGSDARRPVSGFSKGMRQRLALAIALLGDPEILVLDEPLDGLDPAGQVTLKATLRALVDESAKTVIVSSHDLGDVEALADHVVVLDRGRTVMQGPLADLLGPGDRHRVGISDAAAAVEVLRAAGFDARVDGDDVLVDGVSGTDVSRVLARSELYPESLMSARTTLERLFLDITEAR